MSYCLPLGRPVQRQIGPQISILEVPAFTVPCRRSRPQQVCKICSAVALRAQCVSCIPLPAQDAKPICQKALFEAWRSEREIERQIPLSRSEAREKEREEGERVVLIVLF